MSNRSRNDLDWAEIRAQFESGEYSGRAIALKHGIDPSVLYYHAKTGNWKVPEVEATSEFSSAHPPSALDRPLPDYNLSGTGDDRNSNQRDPMASVARNPTDIVADGNAMILRLLSELDATTANIGELHELIEDFNKPGRDFRRRDAMLRAVNLSSRSTIMKNLAAAAKSLDDMKLSRGAKEIEAAKKASEGIFDAPAAPRLVANGR